MHATTKAIIMNETTAATIIKIVFKSNDFFSSSVATNIVIWLVSFDESAVEKLHSTVVVISVSVVSVVVSMVVVSVFVVEISE